MGKKRKKNGDESPIDIGMVMTVSLFLILLTFFILLNSIAVLDERKTRVAIGSLLGAFGALPGGLPPLKTGESIMPPSAPMIAEELGVPQLITIMDKALSDYIKTETVKSGEMITINEEALFQEDRFNFNPLIIPFLDKLGTLISKTDYSIEIVGHTDNMPAQEKGYHSNWELSSLMAIQVMKYLISKNAVLSSRVTTYGNGSCAPIASNKTRRLRAQNRRVDIILNYKASAYVKRIFKKQPSGFFTYKNFDFKIF